jgi:5'-3' exonuclease
MINAIFDLSNMFFRSLFIVGGYGSKQYSFDNQTELDQLMRKVATDVSQVIRIINPSRVIFALDSKSWRKDISIDENEGYKAQRTKSGLINWDNVFKILGEFADILETNGFIISKFDRAEADDIAALWKQELLFNQNQHVIIVSADEDVRQLVQFYPYTPEKFAFCTVFNPFLQGKNAFKKLYVPEKYWDEWILDADPGDFFNRGIDVDKEDFKRILNEPKTKLEKINGERIVLRKIFCGDDGDNVPAIYTWLNDKGKEVRITESKFEKIMDSLGEKTDAYDLMDQKEIIYDQLANISGQRPSFNMADRLNRQLQLVHLDPLIFPEEFVKVFQDKVTEELAKPQVHPQNWNMVSVLEGTRYVMGNGKYKKPTTEASIFGEIDRINLNKALF